MNLTTSIAYSFGTKQKKTIFDQETDIPGPGNYDGESYFRNKNKTKSFSFGFFAKENKIKSETPGPGYYLKSNEDLIGKGCPKFSIGKSERTRNLNVNVSLNSLGEGISSGTMDNPGPGQYLVEEVIDKTKRKVPSYKISTSSKDINYDNKIPGPGYYEPDKNKLKSSIPLYSISKSAREDLFGINKRNNAVNYIPGPGQYSLTPRVREGPKLSMRRGSYYTKEKNTPGPGYYQPEINFVQKKNQGYKIGSSLRDFNHFITKDAVAQPGPGFYGDYSPLKNSKGFKFGKELKYKPMKTYAPGPGSYLIPGTIGNIPNYNLRK